MISRSRYTIVVIVVAAALIAVAFWVIPFVRGIWPAVGPAPKIVVESPEPGEPTPTGPLSAPAGWTVSSLAERVPGARDLAEDFQGNLWVSQPSEGTVSLITLNSKGEAINISAVLRGLKNPHGLAFDPENSTHLYIAQETEVSRVVIYSDAQIEKIADLPKGGRHTTRSLAFGPDGRLYVSIGSTCDVCHELNKEHGSIIAMNRDGSGRETVATGLRNAVFMSFRDSDSSQLWVTEMGRDGLGDDTPPDEVNIIEVGESPEDYGWPICYGDRIHDTDFDDRQYVRDPCEDTITPTISLPAHVAPLGLTFLSDDSLLVALHGSWNSSVPVGYEVIRMEQSDSGYSYAEREDFLSGFLRGGSAIGRPVDVLASSRGTVYISDDKAGAIWQMKKN